MNSSIICQIRGKTYAHFWDEGIEKLQIEETDIKIIKNI